MLYIQEMNEYRKSERYDDFDVDKKEVFLAVMDAHLEWQTRIMNPQVAMPPKAPMNLDGVVDHSEEEVAQASAAPMEDSGQGLENNSQPSENMAAARG